MKWLIKSAKIPHDLHELKEILLINRKITDNQLFFQPTHPIDLSLKEAGLDEKQFFQAIKRIKKAIHNREKVLIVGDYDADGVCATAILWEALDHLGLSAQPFIPHREKHGYGLSEKAFLDIMKMGKFDLIITVDNGIVAHQVIAQIKKQEIDVIVTDHHQPEKKLPPADVVVHSTQLCGATVAWFIARELDQKQALQSLDLAALATVTDQVPLITTNRSFVKHGLKAIQETKRIGLLALFKIINLDPQTINEYSLGFIIGPRINAMGRLAHSLDSLRLLCTRNLQKANRLAQLLEETNQQRQKLTQDLITEARQMLDSKTQKIIFLASENYHQGVIGLIASELVDLFYKPTMILKINDQVAKASVRSIKGVNIIELLRNFRDDFLELGGHEMAAGFSIQTNKIASIKKKLFHYTQKTISDQLLEKQIQADCQLLCQQLDDQLINLLDDFAPFGPANPKPLFLFDQLKVVDSFVLGQNQQHLKIILSQDDSFQVPVIAWKRGHQATEILNAQQIKILASPEINYWQGRKNIQLKLRELDFI